MFLKPSILPTRKTQKSRSRQLVVERLEERLTPAVNVLTYHNDLASTGQNLNETLLTYDSVNSAYFGKIFSTPVDGQIYGQPLTVSGVVIPTGPNAGTHDVVYVATQNNSVYAIDAEQGNVLWTRSFNNPAAGVTSVPSTDVRTEDIVPIIGITSTIAIDPLSRIMYVVSTTKEVGTGATHYIQRLHALDLTDGTSKLGGPAIIADTILQDGVYTYVSGPSVNGTGDQNVNGKITYNALLQNQRAALTLYNNTLYIASSAHGGRFESYHGWILGYDASTLELKAVFNSTPNGGYGGIWMGGGRLSIDSQGFIYASVGNGVFDTQLDANGFPINGNYGDSVIKLAVDPTTSSTNQNLNGWGLKVVDYFTPYNQDQLALQDRDLGSGGILILPDAVGSVAHPHLLVTAGKEGKIYLIDRDNMGKYNPVTDNVVQTISGGVKGLFSTPAYFNGSIYMVGAFNDRGRQYSIANGVMSPAPTALTSGTFLFPGSTPSVSANGLNNAIIWNLDRGTRELRAYKAGDYSQLLWTSNLAGSRDQIEAPMIKFAVPTIANGRVFVGTDGALYGFGLFPEATTIPAAPTQLTARSISGTQVRLNWTDNSDNETAFHVELSMDGLNFSRIGTTSVNATEFLVGSLLPSTQYYFRVSATNFAGTSNPSNSANATTFNSQNPETIDFPQGFAGVGSLVQYNGSAVLSGNYLQLTSGLSQQAGSVFFVDRHDVRRFTSQFTFQLLDGTTPPGDGITFTIQGNSPTALGPGGGGLGYGAGLLTGPPGIPNSVAIKFDLASNFGEGNNSTGLYTNGASPSIPGFVNLDGLGIDLKSQHVFLVSITYDGSTLFVQITDTQTNASVGQTYQNVNIPSIVGSNSAYFGFTGGTGASTATQNIRSFIYSPLTQTVPPAAPSNLQATDIGTTQLRLNWTLNSTDELGVRVLRKSLSETTYSQVAVLGPGVTTFADAGLIAGETYSYRIFAFNNFGDSSFEEVTVSTRSPAPQSVIAGLSGNSVILSWSTSVGATSYKVFRSEVSNGIGETSVPIASGITATSFVDTTTVVGRLYFYRVLAVNNSGDGPLSEQSQVQVNALTFTVGSFLNGVWTIDSNFNGLLDANDQKYTFGLPGDTPVWGDWNGDGKKDFGVYRQGVWYLDSNGIQGWQPSDTTVRFGIAGDIPVAGDWLGDRRDRLGVFRQGTWYIDNNGTFGWQPTDSIVRYGLPGDKPVAGDWRGNGRDRFAVYRDGTWYIDNNGIFGWQSTDAIVRYGIPGDTPVVGDWNGDGRDDMSVYRGDGHWYFDANGQFGWQFTDTVLTLDLGIANPIARSGRGGFALDATTAWLAANAPILTTAQLTPIVEAAITIWKNVGASEEQLAKLRRLNVRITDLPNHRLGMAWDTALAIDVNGAGRGWFIDASPSDHSEYQWRRDQGIAKSGAASAGIDLLTVVLHEMGHALGLDDGGDDLMMGQLGRGERRLPTASLVDAALSD